MRWVTSSWYRSPNGTPKRYFYSMSDVSDLSPDELIQSALELPEAAAELERRYGSIRAILVVIVHALATIRAAFAAYRPAILGHSGTEIKTVADTLFASFDTPAAAMAAALDGHARMLAFNAGRSGDIHAGIPGAPIHPRTGLGFGDVLVMPGNIYGGEVNRAFILGEDTGRDGEILASENFATALGAPPVGVGVHASPHDRAEGAGFNFHIYTDYRDPQAL